MGDVRDVRPGARSAVVGSILGIVPAVALGLLRLSLSEGPEAIPRAAGHIAFTLVYIAPYALVLIASAAPNPGVRGGLLLALGLLSLIASFSAFSLATLVFLPATFVIWFAAFRSLAAAPRLLATALPAAIAGLFIAAIAGFGFYALLLMQDPEPRCWAQTRGPDGQSRWEPQPASESPGRLSVSTLSGGTRAFCKSDITTNTEAAMSIGVLAVALLVMLPVARFRRADP